MFISSVLNNKIVVKTKSSVDKYLLFVKWLQTLITPPVSCDSIITTDSIG